MLEARTQSADLVRPTWRDRKASVVRRETSRASAPKPDSDYLNWSHSAASRHREASFTHEVDLQAFESNLTAWKCLWHVIVKSAELPNFRTPFSRNLKASKLCTRRRKTTISPKRPL